MPVIVEQGHEGLVICRSVTQWAEGILHLNNAGEKEDVDYAGYRVDIREVRSVCGGLPDSL